MSGNGHATASDIRARLTHPIIDADGHWLEFGPFVNEQLRRIGGDVGHGTRREHARISGPRPDSVFFEQLQFLPASSHQVDCDPVFERCWKRSPIRHARETPRTH